MGSKGSEMGLIAAQLGSPQTSIDDLRKRVESGMTPQSSLAYSTDGKTFGYETPLANPLAVGSYVVLRTDAGVEYFGQIITQETLVKDGPEYGTTMDAEIGLYVAKAAASAQIMDRIQIRFIQGLGIILAKLGRGTFGVADNQSVFRDAVVVGAPNELVARFFISSTEQHAALEIGKALHADYQSRVLLRANGFDRHSFLCGQSGSGKTFALGVILEQLLLETELKIVVLDPNSDFVGLNRIRRLTEVNRTRSAALSPQQYDDIGDRFPTVSVKIARPTSRINGHSNALKIRFSDLDPFEQAAVLRLDPLEDREEFYSFWNFIKSLGQAKYSLSDVQAAISNNLSAEARQIGLRIKNLGVADWDIWCSAAEDSLPDTLSRGDWRCLVVDIGALSSTQEKSVIALALLGYFWRNRDAKEPVLIVADEAHNVCPRQPSFDLESLSSDHVVRIAGEGRKFGLYLLLGTQRPEKIHPNAVSQCDNLVLMKMNSRSDLNYVTEMFSQVPPSLLNLSPGFGQGEALIMGKFVTSPTLAKFEGRLTVEGGIDVPSNWAARKPGQRSH